MPQSKTTNSAVPNDQGFKQAYNKTANSAGGIIGFTQKKQAVSLWNIIHHEKEGYRHFLENRIEHENSEFSLHHEFSESSAQKSMNNCIALVDYIKRIGNPFSKENDGKPIRNLATGQEHSLLYNSKLQCLSVGEQLYEQYRIERLEEKSTSIFDPLKRTKPVSTEESIADCIPNFNFKKEAASVQRYISNAECRRFPLEQLFAYELTYVPFFLFDETGKFTKPDKAALSCHLLSVGSTDPLVTAPQSNAFVIDFIAYCRKVAIKSCI